MNRRHEKFKRLFALFLVLVMLATSGNGYSMSALAAGSGGTDETQQTTADDGAGTTADTPASLAAEPQSQTQGSEAQSQSQPQSSTEQSQSQPQSSTEQSQPQSAESTQPSTAANDGTSGSDGSSQNSTAADNGAAGQTTDGQDGAAANGSQDGAVNQVNALANEPQAQSENEPSAGSEGSTLEATSTLVINDGKNYVLSGEEFQLEIQYNVPHLAADQGTEYTNTYIQFTLPRYVKIATHVDQNGEVKESITGNEFDHLEVIKVGSSYIYQIYLKETLDLGRANTLRIGFVTENLVTPDNTSLKFAGFTFNTSYLDSQNNPQTNTKTINVSETTVRANSSWQIEKEIISSDTQNNVLYIKENNEEGYYVTYQITVNDADGVNRLGRLGFDSYNVTDTFPANIPAGGAATGVTDVKIIHGTTEVQLAEGTDYDLIKSGSAVTGITFKTPDTMKDGDSLGQYQEIGDVTNTTYQYTVHYPYDPYTTPGTELDIKTWEMENTAVLNHKPVGGTDASVSDTAEFVIGAYEDNVPSADIRVEKKIQIDNETYVLDSEYQSIYGTPEFSLYTDENCTQMAYNLRKQPMTNIAVNDNTRSSVGDIRYGTYYIRETKGLEGFETAEKIKVVIDQNGAVFFNDAEDAADSGKFTAINIADSAGILQFTKKGDDAYGNKDKNLGGVTFTLTSEGGQEYTATSASDGKVVFHNIPAGKYTLSETAISSDMEENGYTVSDKTYDVEIAGNKVNEPDLAGNNIFKNEAPKGLLEIIKADAETPSKLLSGATFELYGPYESESEAQKAIADISELENKAATLVTDSDGKAVSSPLMNGYYILFETQAPVNYTAGDPQIISITARETKLITINNDPQARVSLSKKGLEEEGAAVIQELAGAEFEIYTSDEKPLYGIKDSEGNYTDVSTEDNAEREPVIITTELDATGNSVSDFNTRSSVSPGTYKYKETKAPDPYVPDNQFHEFTVAPVAPESDDEGWNIAQEITVENYLQYGQILD